MTHRERLLAALSHQQPDKVPIDFGGTISSGIDQIMYRTSGGFNGNAHLDDVVVRNLVATEPGVVIGSESTEVYTDAWSRVTKVVNSTPGTTIRWQFSANDTSDNGFNDIAHLSILSISESDK